MNIILLSGGSGKRLWPLSNDIRSKQFIKFFKNDKGNYESMVQRIYNELIKLDDKLTLTIATSKNQVSQINNQLNSNVGISIEPARKDTFPAIALATAYLHDVMKVSEDDAVVVCPVDPYVNSDYFQALKKLYELSLSGKSNLTLMGIEPTYPSEKYGYIIPNSSEDVCSVKMFKEKPKKEQAEEYIKDKALWNGGVFAYKVKYLLEKAHELIDFVDYNDLFNKYEELNKISFDYAVVEKEKSINVMRFNGIWKDLGTWDTLTESLSENIIGSAKLDESSENTHVINELDIPILCVGLKNIVVAASPDGILVADKEKSGEIKQYAESFDSEVKYIEKSWGTYKVIEKSDEVQVVKIHIYPDKKLSYHCHKNRKEIWNILKGKGQVIIDGENMNISAGDIIEINKDVYHTIEAKTDLEIIEFQYGKNIDVNDKIKKEV